MDKKHKELKKQIEFYYESIKYFESRLEDIREKQCNHPVLKKGNYMFAPGHITENVTICTICGKPFYDYDIKISST
jgi:hypothetical protein